MPVNCCLYHYVIYLQLWTQSGNRMLEYPFTITHTWSGAQDKNSVYMLIHPSNKNVYIKHLQLTIKPNCHMLLLWKVEWICFVPVKWPVMLTNPFKVMAQSQSGHSPVVQCCWELNKASKNKMNQKFPWHHRLALAAISLFNVHCMKFSYSYSTNSTLQPWTTGFQGWLSPQTFASKLAIYSLLAYEWECFFSLSRHPSDSHMLTHLVLTCYVLCLQFHLINGIWKASPCHSCVRIPIKSLKGI